MRRHPRDKPKRTRWKKSRLEDLINLATLDAQGDEEEQQGFFIALEEHLRFPFKATVGGVGVRVRGIEVDEADRIVAICGRERPPVPLLDLELPKPPPRGAEWIEAYRLWVAE